MNDKNWHKKFLNQKKTVMQKFVELDKSKKGSVDEDIVGLLKKINKLKNFYTTSSCSGRIQVLSSVEGGKKHTCQYHYTTHGLVKVGDSKKVYSALIDGLASRGTNNKMITILRQSGPILHICCASIDDAIGLIKIARDSGFKHSGIQSIKNKIAVELKSAIEMDAIIAKSSKILVDEKYFKNLIAYSNTKQEKSKKILKKFEKNLKDLK